MLLIFNSELPSPQINYLVEQIEEHRALVMIGPQHNEDLAKPHQPALTLTLSAESPARLAELSLICGHLICELVEGELFGV
jgi:hypothetical protein